MHHLKKARRLSIVPRWSIIPTIRQQNVAEHSFQVAQLASELCLHHIRREDPEFHLDVLTGALDHDEDEAVKGDMPGGPVKKKDFKALVKERGQAYGVVKMADMLEAYLFLHEEVALGNKQVKPIIAGYHTDIGRLLPHVEWVIPPSRMATVLKRITESSLGLEMGDFYEKS